MNALVCDLQDVRKLLELGEEVDHDVLQRLISDIPRRAPSFSQSELQLLADELAHVMQLVEEQRADVAEQLADIHHGRSGIAGYNHLKALHKAQRLSKRA
ncbi:MAG TPA: hypothetical protein DFR83_21270 [Deltaproteobacteria bacterium]|nr:hypothetical protein [Deltaproteobacteria bacterium]